MGSPWSRGVSLLANNARDPPTTISHERGVPTLLHLTDGEVIQASKLTALHRGELPRSTAGSLPAGAGLGVSCNAVEVQRGRSGERARGRETDPEPPMATPHRRGGEGTTVRAAVQAAVPVQVSETAPESAGRPDQGRPEAQPRHVGAVVAQHAHVMPPQAEEAHRCRDGPAAHCLRERHHAAVVDGSGPGPSRCKRRRRWGRAPPASPRRRQEVERATHADDQLLEDLTGLHMGERSLGRVNDWKSRRWITCTPARVRRRWSARQAVLERETRQLHPRRDPQLVGDARPVGGDGLLAEVELGGDLAGIRSRATSRRIWGSRAERTPSGRTGTSPPSTPASRSAAVAVTFLSPASALRLV